MRCNLDDVIIVEDVVTEDCVRKLHVMSNSEICMQLPCQAKVAQTVEGGVFHLRAEWMYWGMLDIKPREWPKPRRLLVWSLREGERVSDAIRAAAEMWTKAVGWEPKYVWIRSLPKGAEWCQEVYGCILLETTWIPRNCVAVGGRR